MIKHKIVNNFVLGEDNKNLYTIPSGALSGNDVLIKSIPITLNSQNRDTGYEDVVNNLFKENEKKVINPFVDTEKIKFNSAKRIVEGGFYVYSDLKLKFYFSSHDNPNIVSTPATNWESAGFTPDEINNSLNSLRFSFFRVDFYDSENTREQNFLFSEFLTVGFNQTTQFSFNRLYWFKEDQNFKNDTYVDLYFDVTFFNAKNGSSVRFINKTNPEVDATVESYNQNPDWRFTKIRLLNPYFNLLGVGSTNKVFYVDPRNDNQDDLINFTELHFID
tara:strand:+ start:147 stop:974 length:828 start_codon:yes stop_codon:yes gene_type:complete